MEKGKRDREHARQPEGPTGEREGRPLEDTAGRRNVIGYSGQYQRGTGTPMPSNIEIKARLADLPRTRGLVAAINNTPPQTLRQRDTFFRCATGRLKLRETGAGQAELIFYSRPDVAAAKQSDYEITPVADPVSLKSVLRRALGVTHVVEKTRVLYLVGQTRVHLDSVDGLGDFLELEVVLRSDQSPADGHALAAEGSAGLVFREIARFLALFLVRLCGRKIVLTRL